MRPLPGGRDLRPFLDRNGGLAAGPTRTAARAERDETGRAPAIAAAAANGLGVQAERAGPGGRGGRTAECDDRRRATIAAGCALVAEGDDPDRLAGIAARAADGLCHDPVRVLAGGHDDPAVSDEHIAAVAAGAAAAAIADDAVAGAAGARRTSKALRKDAKGARAFRLDLAGVGDRHRSALGRRSARSAAAGDIALAAPATDPGAALRENAVRVVACGDDGDGGR